MFQAMTAPQDQKSVRELRGTFILPQYQRGYRWTRRQVCDFVNDIFGFAAGPSSTKYFLQPVVVYAGAAADTWNIVDGQQRLTTMYLLHRALTLRLGLDDLPAYTLCYAARPATTQYLAQELYRTGSEPDAIDQWHIYAAWRVIAAHVQNTDEDVVRAVRDAFLDRVCVLWFDAAAAADGPYDPVAHFMRLNTGRIPLTEAELVRAVLLQPRAGEPHAAARQTLTGARWDAMERGLRDPGFWAFTGRHRPADPPVRMDFVLRLWAARAGAGAMGPFAYVRQRLAEQGTAPQAVWDEITQLWDQLQAWYADDDTYHWLGWLVRTDPEALAALPALFGMRGKQELAHELRRAIGRLIRLPAGRTLATLNYADHRELIGRILFLFTVEYSRGARSGGQRFPFAAWDAVQWSIEHISPRKDRSPASRKDWKIWLLGHKEALEHMALREADTVRSADVAKRCAALLDNFGAATEAECLDLQDAVGEVLAAGADDRVHGLGNLVLLDCSSNSALGNAWLPVKRAMLQEKICAGTFVPPATAAVVLRFFSPQNHDLPWWSADDAQAYLAQIRQTLAPFWEAAHG